MELFALLYHMTAGPFEGGTVATAHEMTHSECEDMKMILEPYVHNVEMECVAYYLIEEVIPKTET